MEGGKSIIKISSINNGLNEQLPSSHGGKKARAKKHHEELHSAHFRTTVGKHPPSVHQY